jgi:hypothetical protein
MRPFLATLLLLPTLVFAQTLTLTVNGATTAISGNGSTTISTLALNGTACSYTVGGNWAGTGLTTACSSLQIWLTANSCGSTGGPTTTNSPPDLVVYTAQAGSLAGGLANDTFSFAFTSLPGFNTNAGVDGGVTCGSVNDFTNYLCAGVVLKDTTGACTSTVVQAPSVNIRYDNIPPIPPTVFTTALDTKLGVSLSPGDPSDSLLYFLAGFAVDVDGGPAGNYTQVGGQISVNNPKVTITGLTNGTTYLVVGYSVDEASNVSLMSVPVTGEPVTTYGFYANYLDAGGQPGGCGDAGGGPPSVLALAALLVFGVTRRQG